MLKRYFIPFIVVLAVLATGIYFITERSPVRDVRAVVPVEQFTLSNGLTVVVMPSDRIPLVSHLLIVKAGAADDPYGKTGLAHYLEHLMFTGTSNYPEGAYDQAIARVGGAQNAYTSNDHTLYYATVPKQYLSLVMSMEVDRLTNLEFSTTHAARELKVIKEERNMRVENSPVAQWLEQMDALTFLNHPYRNPTIGWAEDMATFTAADAKQFFGQHYRAGNMILVVAGDVTMREVRRYAQRYYGDLPGGDVVARQWPKEPPMRLARRGEMRDARVNQPRLLRQYVAPSLKEGDHENAVPLAVFAQYLGGGDTSALYNALVREQHVATSVYTEYDPLSVGPALLRIVAIPAEGVSLEKLEAALDQELKRILAAPEDVAAFARARTLLTAEVTFAQDGLQQIANVMARIFAVGLNEQFFYDWSTMIAGASDAQVLSAGRSVITPNTAVTGYLLQEAQVTHAP